MKEHNARRRRDRLLITVIPVLLVVVLAAVPVFVTLSRMGALTPEPTANVKAAAPEDAPELVFVADYDYDPYSFLNADGTPNGMDTELAYELANRLGMRPRIEFGTWSECKGKIKDGQADVLLGLEIFVDGAATGTLKSIPMGTDTLSIIGRDSVSDAAALAGKRVGVSFGSALMGLFNLKCEYVQFFTYSEMFEALDKGEIDYGICHASVAYRLIQKHGYAFAPSMVLMESFPTMGIRQDEPELVEKIDRALEEMSADGTVAALRDKWIVTNVQNRTVGDVLKNYQSFFIVYAVLAVVVLAAYAVSVATGRSSAIRKQALDTVQAERKQLEDALAREIAQARDEKAYQLAILSNAYSYSRINVTQNRIIPPIIERENGLPVDYTDRFPDPLPSYEEVFAPGAARYVDDAYRESYKAYHSCAHLAERFAAGDTMPEYVCRIYSSKLGWHYRKYVTYLAQDEDGEIYGMSVAYDITKEYEAAEREKQYKRKLEDARKAAEDANRSKTNFLFSMSHDIRTPINAITGFTSMAVKHIDDKEKVLDCLNKTQKAGGMLLSLINSVLEVSSIESGKAKAEEQPGDVYYSFVNFESTMRELAEAKDIRLDFSFGEIRDRYVYADFSRCMRVFVNIISNAIKYTPEGGAVQVRCEQLPDEKEGFGTYRYTFTDNGIGMSEEFQQRVFDQFSREKTATVSGVQGNGLGMAVCKSFVELMGGTIGVKSRQGVGTTFTVILPFRLQEKEEYTDPMTGNIVSAARGAAALPETDFTGKRVLLVEDNELNREIASDMLAEQGLAVDEADDGTTAVQTLREKGPDAYDFILMDIQMPKMNGYEATKAIREMYPDARIPIIALSANAFAEDKKKSLEAGMDDHVAKPINLKELFGTLAKFVK